MATKMETLDPSALSDIPTTVTYDPKSDTVTLPGGVVSLAGITSVTGGAEMSCGSCMLAFAFSGTLVGLSCIAVGLWDLQSTEQTSPLLYLGFVILASSLLVVGSVGAYYLLTKKKREMTQEEREDGKEILLESDRVIKKVTV